MSVRVVSIEVDDMCYICDVMAKIRYPCNSPKVKATNLIIDNHCSKKKNNTSCVVHQLVTTVLSITVLSSGSIIYRYILNNHEI